MFREQQTLDKLAENFEPQESLFEMNTEGAPNASAPPRPKKKRDPLHVQSFKKRREHTLLSTLGVNMEDERKRIKERKKKFKATADEDILIPVFKESNRYLNYWNNVVLVLAIFNSFAVPIEMTVYTQLSAITWYWVSDYIINFLFFIDIIIQFNTGYYDSEG